MRAIPLPSAIDKGMDYLNENGRTGKRLKFLSRAPHPVTATV